MGKFVSKKLIQLVDQIASVYFFIDEKMNIHSPSSVLIPYLKTAKNTSPPAYADGFFEHFEVARPAKLRDLDDIKNVLNSMVLMILHDHRFAVRGQFVRLDDEDDQLLFIGAPWLAWIQANAPDNSLKMDDFKSWDSQLDQLILISTERQNLEDLKQLTKELREARDAAEFAKQSQADFFAVMSHEMRTPLSGVISALELIETDGLTSQACQMLKISRESADNLKAVVNNVLDYSKLQADGFENQIAPFDFCETLASTSNILLSNAKKNNTVITWSVTPDFPDFILGDADKIRQVIINLLSNAVKFTKDGAIEIDAFLEGNVLHIIVTDNGIGIPEELQDKIFDPFLTSQPLEDNQSGTGLGLSITRRLVEIMGGNISFSSSAAEGSQFRVQLPTEIINQPLPKTPTRGDESVNQFDAHVLLAEDNKTNQFLIKQILEKRGLTVDVADNGRQAANMAIAQPYDMVLMDISMPIMDGITATARIRQTHSIDRLPVIALTAHVGSQYHQQFLESGMNRVLTKPIEKSELTDILTFYLPPLPSDVTRNHNEKPCIPKETDNMFDPTLTNEMVEDIGKEAFIRVATLFQSEIDEGITNIQNAYLAENIAEIAELAHRVRSTSKALGCIGLGDILEKIENQCRTGDDSLLGQQLNTLPEIADYAFKSLDKFKESL